MPVILRSRTIYLLPTRACMPLGAVLLAIAYAAVSQNNAGAYLLGFFLVSLGVVGMIHTHFALTRLRARTGRIPPTFAGGVARVPVILENGSRRPRRAVFRVARGREWRWPWQRAAGTDEPPPPVSAVTQVPLPGGGTAELLLLVPAPRRGRELFGRLVVSTRYPLGFSRGIFFESLPDVELLVYPTPAGERPLPEPPPAPAGADYLTADRPAGGMGDDYSGSRPYRPGDSQRHVDWRAAARGGAGGGGPLLVKQFAGVAREGIVLDWAMTDGAGLDVEARLSQLCRWLLDAEDTIDLPYGLRLPGGFELPPGRGQEHLHRGLRALALHEAKVGSDGPTG